MNAIHPGQTTLKRKQCTYQRNRNAGGEVSYFQAQAPFPILMLSIRIGNNFAMASFKVTICGLEHLKNMKPKKPIEALIMNVRDQKVILDADLAELYGVPTYRFNEAFKRNRERFPDDFAFQLTAAEYAELKSNPAIAKSQSAANQEEAANSSQFAMSSPQSIENKEIASNRSQIVTSSIKYRGAAYRP